tara:strand:+ start:1465 stop:1836 length:372 start_codon:yes stop_codon:yes gene_type:complete
MMVETEQVPQVIKVPVVVALVVLVVMDRIRLVVALVELEHPLLLVVKHIFLLVVAEDLEDHLVLPEELVVEVKGLSQETIILAYQVQLALAVVVVLRMLLTAVPQDLADLVLSLSHTMPKINK